MLVPFTHRIVAVSPAVKQSLITYEAISAKRIEIIFNGIDLAKFETVHNTKNIREKLKIESDCFVLGMIARLSSEKDPVSLIQAISLVADKYPRVKLLLIGDGPRRRELEDLVFKLKLTDKVIFTGSRRDIPQLLSILDVVVLSTFYEGTSITLLEAMAASKPVIASSVGGNPAVIEDGVSGFLVSGGDCKALADKILQLLADSDLRRQLAKGGYQRALERFSLKQMVDAYESLYNQTLA